MTRTAQTARLLAASAKPFDWDQHQRDLNRKMADLRLFMERDAAIGRQIVAATSDMVADVSAIIGDSK